MCVLGQRSWTNKYTSFTERVRGVSVCCLCSSVLGVVACQELIVIVLRDAGTQSSLSPQIQAIKRHPVGSSPQNWDTRHDQSTDCMCKLPLQRSWDFGQLHICMLSRISKCSQGKIPESSLWPCVIASILTLLSLHSLIDLLCLQVDIFNIFAQFAFQFVLGFRGLF